jgi:hypothetical protein
MAAAPAATVLQALQAVAARAQQTHEHLSQHKAEQLSLFQQLLSRVGAASSRAGTCVGVVRIHATAALQPAPDVAVQDTNQARTVMSRFYALGSWIVRSCLSCPRHSPLTLSGQTLDAS